MRRDHPAEPLEARPTRLVTCGRVKMTIVNFCVKSILGFGSPDQGFLCRRCSCSDDPANSIPHKLGRVLARSSGMCSCGGAVLLDAI